ncbi:DUF881 domain-containing protein [Spongisporangium articulatum]|uniref:DUF881 domain-containing protein n=1 Tax=Spongisporangium articulatum TaxID=3362603 RepID=A0ABW8AKB2_9ACTN
MSAPEPDQPTRGRRGGPGAVGVVLVMVVAGLLFTTSAQTAGGSQLRSQSVDLASLLETANAQQARKQAELSALRERYERASALTAAGDRQLKQLQARLDAARPSAGRTAVSGQGLTVTLDDAPHNGALPAGASPDDLVVHQQDVQAVVNALWAGGASAMMLMDQRVISTSAVRCVGNTLILQGRVYSPPYTVRAVGDPAKLRAALDASPDVQYYLQYVAAMDLGWKVSPPTHLDLPEYQGPLSLSYATTP